MRVMRCPTAAGSRSRRRTSSLMPRSPRSMDRSNQTDFFANCARSWNRIRWPLTKKRSSKTPAAILIVDDEAAVRALERRVLETDGYLVTEASDGTAGIAALAQQ